MINPSVSKVRSFSNLSQSTRNISLHGSKQQTRQDTLNFEIGKKVSGSH